MSSCRSALCFGEFDVPVWENHVKVLFFQTLNLAWKKLHIYNVSGCFPWAPDEDAGFPETGVTDGGELLRG